MNDLNSAAQARQPRWRSFLNRESGLLLRTWGFLLGAIALIGLSSWFLWSYSSNTNVSMGWLLYGLQAVWISGVTLGTSFLINQHYADIVEAIYLIRDGDFHASRLQNASRLQEVRQVNTVFNGMVDQIAQMDQDRALMLAGISHDLRTPLARLRLETEMSVPNEVARGHMVRDMEQIDAIVQKFLEYARPSSTVQSQVILFTDFLNNILDGYARDTQLRIQSSIVGDYLVQADEVDLGRIIHNILENAKKYGKTPGMDCAQVRVAIVSHTQDFLILEISDKGVGVRPELLPKLGKPFFRGDAIRSAANGAGLGLSIVDRAARRQGGSMSIEQNQPSGLKVQIKLRQV